MTKEQAIEKINKTPNVYLNNDQKIIAKRIINSISQNEDILSYFDFIMKRSDVGFKFDVAPEIATGRLAVVNEMKKLNLNVNSKADSNENKLIIGDNYEALKNLLLTYKEKIDVIYIDPPYNTQKSKEDGNNSSKEGSASKFVYKDKFGRNGWLNMMRDRLVLAKKLLSSSGVIFISIDDNEQAYLKILMDDIFGEDNCIAAIIVQKKSGGGQSTSYYKGHDHLLVYAKNRNEKKQIFIPHKNPQWKKIEIDGKKYAYNPDSIRKMHGKFDRTKLIKGQLNHRNVFFEDYKITFSKEKQKEIEEKIRKKKIILVYFKPLKANILCKAEPYEIFDAKKLIYSIITSWTSDGQKTLDEIMNWNKNNNNYFEAPKSVSLLVNLLKYNLKSGIVLDFFAGSGTTGHAVMELNKNDGGNRNFILVTNNENDIALNVTYERLHRIIKGKGSNGEINFNWIKNNKPYLNIPLRVFNIKHFNVETNQSDKLKKITDFAISNLQQLNPLYKPNNIQIYYDLDGLNPLNESQKRQIYSTDKIIHEKWEKIEDNRFYCTCGKNFQLNKELLFHLEKENNN